MNRTFRFPAWTITLAVVVLSVYYAHAAIVTPPSDAVHITDQGLFVIANEFAGNMTTPVTNGTVMSTLHPGNWGNSWLVNATDHLSHIVNFKIQEQANGKLYANYNATISGNVVVFIDLGSSQVNDFYAAVSWT